METPAVSFGWTGCCERIITGRTCCNLRTLGQQADIQRLHSGPPLQRPLIFWLRSWQFLQHSLTPSRNQGRIFIVRLQEEDPIILLLRINKPVNNLSFENYSSVSLSSRLYLSARQNPICAPTRKPICAPPFLSCFPNVALKQFQRSPD